MGCPQSRIDNEESVTRCKDRHNHMKDAVSTRNAFSSAHTAYYPPSSPSCAPPDHSPPPPPPLPAFSPSPLKRSSSMPPGITASPATTPGERAGLYRPGIDKSPMSIDEEEGDEEDREVKLQNNLHRLPRLRKSNAVTPPSPPMPESKGMVWDYFYMVENMPGSVLGGGGEIENEDEVHDDYDNDVTSDRRDSGGMRMRFEGNDSIEMEFKTPEKQTVVVVLDDEDQQSEVRAKEEVEVEGGTKAVTAMATGENMVKVMGAIDDHFLKASECTQEVSRML